MTTRAYLKRIVSAFLAFAIIFGCIPAFKIALPSFAADGDAEDNRVTDPSTLDRWKLYFGPDVMHTQNAGGVWMDKTVLTDTSAFPSSVTMSDAQKNFLVALSAIAANKEIVGYSTIPTDTMLVLDVSDSMNDSNSVGDLVTAANSAIQQLLAVNKNNRVGVVLYSGRSTTGSSTYAQGTTLLLPLDRYTLTSGTTYLNGANNGSVSVNNRVRNSDGDPVSASKAVAGSTYIQAGLYEAMKQFEAADPVISGDNFQDGQQRLPIMVLMSDGAPTTATSSFANVGTSNAGRGNAGSATDSVGFLTQLTASYVLNRMENHYDCAGRGLFYTLGLGVGDSEVAMSVLDPENSTGAINGYWREYLNLSGGSGMNLTVPSTNSSATKNISVYKNSNATVQHYVDKYFEADNNQELIDVFASIVNEIIIQSRYYATHLEGGTPDLSGYITFEDEIGAFMEVKDIKGILLGDTLFTGAMLTSMLNSNQSGGLGTVERPSDLGLEFIGSVKDRLGITDTLAAIALIDNAYNAGQLSYTNATKFSNYIGWYAAADGSYVGFWDEGKTADPARAVYKIKSYGFLGQAEGNIKDSDMMYMTVQVRTHIATGEQTVLWKIPAALIPMVTYKVELEGNSEATATNVKLTREDAEPIRLLFETGLRDNINELNVGQITDPKHVATDGSRVFWTNHWDISAPDHEHHVTTSGSFTPSEQNERFYYTTDAVVYELVNGNYVEVRSNQTLNPNKTYYHARYIFRSGVSTAEEYFEQIAPESLALAQRDSEEGNWYIPLGTVFRYLANDQYLKSENKTDSAHYTVYSHIERTNASYEMRVNLGNNGMLKMVPATGIKLSKTLSLEEPGASKEFQFKLVLKDAQGNALSGTYETLLADLDQTTGTAGTVRVTGGEVTVDLAAGKTLYITGLPAGATYTVEEVSSNIDYKVQSAYVNGVHMSGKIAAGTLAANVLDDVDFVNEPTSEGDLIIRKVVTHPFGAGYVIPANKVFDIDVTVGAALNGETYDVTYSNGTTDEVTVANGKIHVQLKHGEAVSIHGLPEETVYEITESLLPAGFAIDEAASSNLTGAIVGESNVQATLVNKYVPDDVSVDVSIEINKLLSGRDWLSTDSFQFVVEQVNANGAVVQNFGTVTISGADAQKKQILALKDTYDAAGTYYYHIYEVVGATDKGITYDTANRYFSVTVADVDMNGQLEIVSINNVQNTVVNGRTVSATFSNSYAAYVGTEITVQVGKKMEGNSFPLNGFQFGLYSDEACTELVMLSSLTDANGKAVFELAYSVNAIGTHTYYLKEINSGINGMSYSAKVYQVEVTVSDNYDGTISAVTVIHGLAQGETVPTFTNRYDPEDATLILNGHKNLDGRVHNAGEFSFNLYETDSSYSINGLTPIQTVTNAANGDFIFRALTYTAPGTHYYVVNETKGSLGGVTYDETVYEIKVVVEDENGVLHVTTEGIANGIAFENTYEPKPAEVILSGRKTLDGRNLADGEFSFVLKDASGKELQTVKNVGAAFTFDKLTYDEPGVYTYTVNEVKGSLGGVTYDEAVYTVTVTVTDDGAGQLHAQISYRRNGATSTGIVFRNGYAIDTPFEIEIGGDKELGGRDLTAGEFEFVLLNALTGQEIGRAKNDANGKFEFAPYSVRAAGVYYFNVVEVNDGQPGMDYDASVIEVVVTLVDNGNGTLSESGRTITKGRVRASGVTFTNTYYSGTLAVQKEVAHNLGSSQQMTTQEFEIRVDLGRALAGKTYAADGAGYTSVTLDANGRVILKLQHGETVDIYGLPEGTVATVTELNTPADYSQTFRDSDGSNDGIVTIIRNATVSVDVVNLYTPTYNLPATVVVGGNKIFTGRENNEWQSGDEFTVVLEQWTDSGWVEIAGAREVLTDSNREYAFDLNALGIKYTAPGRYSYQVREILPEEDETDDIDRIAGVTYDRTLHTFTVVVEDPEMKGLVITSVIADETDAAFTKNGDVWSKTDFDFHNTYSTSGNVAVSIDVQKGATNYGGNPVNLGQFQFKLSPMDGTPGTAMTVYADSIGEARFFLSFTAKGTYKYTLEEVNNGLYGMEYDPTDYTVTIEVSDNQQGGLKADVTIVDDLGKPYDVDQELLFINTYDPDDVTLDFDVSKELNGRDLAAGEFDFILKQWLNGSWQQVATGTNDADGKVAFADVNGKPLTLNKVGTYFYQISEDSTKTQPSVTNDTTVYNVAVTVTDNNGKLEAAYRVESLTGSKMVFTNNYDAEDVEYIPEVKKEWTSINGTKTNLVGGEFRFELKRDGVLIGTGTNDANGKVIFTEAYNNAFVISKAGDYTYTIAEVKGSNPGITYDSQIHTIIVQVKDNWTNGKLEVVETEATEAVYTFNNRYEAAPAELVLEGQKNYNLPLTGGEFTFELYDAEGKLIQSVKNGAHHLFVFDKLVFDEPGVYKYTVKEMKPDDALESITYDETVHDVIVKVADNGQGQLYVESINESAIAALDLVFTNHYDAKDTQFVPTVNKIWDKGNGEKTALVGGEFRFELKRNGVLIGTGINDANGKVIFTEAYANAFVISAAGEYTYTITEVNGGQVLNGVTYDSTVRTVKITVTDNTEVGELQITNVQGDNVSFTNRYEAEDAELTLEGEKNYNLPLDGGEFTFELYDAQGKLIDRVQNDGNKKFTFKKLTFSAPGEYKYTVKEYKPDDASPSITYDEKVHEITVKVIDNKLGQLVIEQINGKAVAELNLTFTNVYKALPTQFVPTVGKIWDEGNGKKTALVGGEFRFELKRDGVLIGTGTNDASGKVTFTEVYANAFVITEADTYVYTVTEVNGGQTLNGITYDDMLHVVKVTVVDNTKTGKLEISNVQGNNVYFTNRYKADDAELILDGQKHYNLPLTGGEFTFELYDAQGKLLQSVKNDGNKFAFEKLTFSAPGEYKYTVKEYKPANALASITYDETVHEVIVKVADDGQGKLYVESINGDETLALDLVFTNHYDAKDTQFVPTVNKIWDKGNGEKANLVGGEFRFELKRNDKLIGTGVNDANGKVIFTEAYAGAFVISAAGDYTYTITETNGGQILNGVIYDDAVHVVKITVVDNTEIGELQITNVQGDNVSFTNRYEAKDAELVLEGLKNYNLPLIGGEFIFELYDAQSQLLQSVKNDGNKFAFEKLTFSAPGEYQYTVKEYKPDDASPSITYDEKVYEVIVKVSDDKLGQLYVNSINGMAAEELNLTFTNVYKALPTQFVPTVGKIWDKGNGEKAELIGGEFRFELERNGVLIGTGINDANGKVIFTEAYANAFVITEAGDYVYTITEVNGGQTLNGVTYDDAVHVVKITVVDNTKTGKLEVADVQGDNVSFTNRYEAKDAELVLEGKKNYNLPLTGGEFTFELYDAQGKLLQSVKNDGNSKFVFEKLTFGAPGEYKYTVKEYKPDDASPSITYDEKVHEITVKVSDNKQGQLFVEQINGAAVEELNLTFTNVYTKPADITLGMDVTKVVENKGTAVKGPDGFVFILMDEAGQEIGRIVSDENGNASFESLSFSEADIGKTFVYTIIEEQGDLDNMEYDDTVHTITIVISLNAENKLVATVNGEAASVVEVAFTNVYTADVPYTGDHSNPTMWVAMLFVTGGVLAVLTVDSKRKNKAQ